MRSVIAALALLAACSPPPATDEGAETTPETGIGLAPDSFTFSCDGGRTFSVGYDAAAGTATINAGGQIYTLASAVSASGARYSANGVEFWEHQTEATLTGAAGGPYENCRR